MIENLITFQHIPVVLHENWVPHIIYDPSLQQFPLCLSDIINSCELVYAAPLNISVNKHAVVMLKFVIIQG